MSLETELRKLKYRVLNGVVRGAVQLLKDSGGLQIIQATLLGDEVSEDIERLQQYGFTGSLPSDSECVVIMVGGTRSHPLCISAESRAARKAAIANVTAATGLSIQPEDVLIYTTDENFVLLRSGGNIIVGSPETLRFQAKTIEFFAELKIKWDVGGRGFDYYPTHTDTWETGSVAGTAHNITPPEHPPDPAQ